MNDLLPDPMRSSIPYLKQYVRGILAWSLIIAGFSLIVGYDQSFLLMHKGWGRFFDAIMPHVTHLADGAIIGGILGMIFAVKKPKISLSLLISLILVSIAIAILKNSLFPDWDRPATIFGEEEVRLLSLGKEHYKSFPSGHSAAAACLGWFICLVVSTRWWAIVTIVLTIFLGWTRVYLGVHFPADVAAGFVLGVFCAFAGSSLVRLVRLKGLSENQRMGKILLIVSFGFLILGLLNTIDKYYLVA